MLWLYLLIFIRRTTQNFTDITVLISLYNSLVRSRLEYCSSIWSPTTKCLIDKLERVQKRFVKYLCFRKSMTYDNDEYMFLCDIFKLNTLQSRRKICDLMFLNKILNNRVNCAYILGEITFYTPIKSLRKRNLFYVKTRIELRGNSAIPRILTLANSYDHFDYFSNNILSFKRMLVDYFP